MLTNRSQNQEVVLGVVKMLLMVEFRNGLGFVSIISLTSFSGWL